MLKKIYGLFLICIMVLFCVVTASAEVVVSQAAPDFTLTDSNGQQQSLSDFKGKYVVLEWLNHECPFVKKHYDSGNMQSLQKKYTDQEVVWLSIVSSAPGKQGYFEPDELNKLTKEKGASPTAVLRDPSGDVGRQYGAKTTPHIYIVDREQTLIYQGAIDSIAGFDQAEIKEAENYIDTVLGGALEGGEVEALTTTSYGCSVKY